MRFISYRSHSGTAHLAARSGDEYVDLRHPVDASIPTSMTDFLAGGREMLQRTTAALKNGSPLSREALKLLAPVQHTKVICVGLNYADHARETGKEPPPEPVIFCKFPTTVSAATAIQSSYRGSATKSITKPSWSPSSDAAVATSRSSRLSITSPATPAATMSPHATGSSESPAANGYWASRSTP